MGSAPGPILLKLSGGILGGTDGPLDPDALLRIAHEIASADRGVAVVVGGGNILRGAASSWLDRVHADALGMMATVVNALALQACLEKEGQPAIIQSAVVAAGTDPVDVRRGIAALERGEILLLAGGTGNPFVTTDTAAAIRAASLGASLLAKASNVAGVFTADPAKDPEARRLETIGYDAYLEQAYGVMDQAAVQICRDRSVPILVFDATEKGAIGAVLRGEPRNATRIGESSPR
jgi:uridylate kinase